MAKASNEICLRRQIRSSLSEKLSLRYPLRDLNGAIQHSVGYMSLKFRKEWAAETLFEVICITMGLQRLQETTMKVSVNKEGVQEAGSGMLQYQEVKKIIKNRQRRHRSKKCRRMCNRQLENTIREVTTVKTVPKLYQILRK